MSRTAGLTASPSRHLPVKRATPYYPGLRAEIARDGISVPVIIQVDESGAPWLMDGHHRVTAAVDLGLPTVPWADDDTD
jgi:ParB-like chromosome segregation protein Spo0J